MSSRIKPIRQQEEHEMCEETFDAKEVVDIVQCVHDAGTDIQLKETETGFSISIAGSLDSVEKAELVDGFCAKSSGKMIVNTTPTAPNRDAEMRCM